MSHADDDDREIADAEALFRNEHEPGPNDSEPEAEAPDLASVDPEGGYDLADASPPPKTPAPEPVSPEPPPVAPTPRRPDASERTTRPERTRTPAPAPVDQPWSRLGEWGPDLLRLGIVAAITATLIYVTFSIENLLLPVVIAAVGLVILIVLSYPIAITLERPVRMTPEQAVNDFFASLSHHRPHYRRMWTLLSSAGRTSPEFDSFITFRAYWSHRLAELRAGSDRGGWWTPLDFHVSEFEADKSAGQDAIAARYTLNVVLRGQQSDTPLHSSRTSTTLSRGPDRMWYLDEGILP